MGNLEFRKAALSDVKEVEVLFRAAMRKLEANGIVQWDQNDPSIETIQADIKAGELYVGEIDGRIAVTFVLNRDADAVYDQFEWDYENFAIVHRLCVHPEFQRMGLATKAMLRVEQLAREMPADAIRLDAFTENAGSNGLYQKLGYRLVGVAPYKKDRATFYEKYIGASGC